MGSQRAEGPERGLLLVRPQASGSESLDECMKAGRVHERDLGAVDDHRFETALTQALQPIGQPGLDRNVDLSAETEDRLAIAEILKTDVNWSIGPLLRRRDLVDQEPLCQTGELEQAKHRTRTLHQEPNPGLRVAPDAGVDQTLQACGIHEFDPCQIDHHVRRAQR
jgi:hypothetical protein